MWVLSSASPRANVHEKVPLDTLTLVDLMMMMSTSEGDSEFDYDLLKTKQKLKGLGRTCSAPPPGDRLSSLPGGQTIISILGNDLTLHK